jgi:predicted DNA-binding transcriptional regulator AlpA
VKQTLALRDPVATKRAAALNAIIDQVTTDAVDQVLQNLPALITGALGGAPQREYLSPREAAEFAGLSVPTLYLWRTRGEGPPFSKLARRVLYRRTDLIAWLDARRRRGSK